MFLCLFFSLFIFLGLSLSDSHSPPMYSATLYVSNQLFQKNMPLSFSLFPSFSIFIYYNLLFHSSLFLSLSRFFPPSLRLYVHFLKPFPSLVKRIIYQLQPRTQIWYSSDHLILNHLVLTKTGFVQGTPFYIISSGLSSRENGQIWYGYKS